jgi:hypothetical protein
VSVSDDSNKSDSTTRLVQVENMTPIVALDPIAAINETGIADVTGSFTDAGLYDAHTLTVAWGDPNNSSPSTFELPASLPFSYPYLIAGISLSSTTDGAVLTITSFDPTTGQIGFHVQHEYVDDGLAPGNGVESDLAVIKVSVVDDDGAIGTDTRFITINNVAPVVALNSEGQGFHQVTH